VIVLAGDPYEKEREAMVENQIAARGICDRNVLDAMRKVPRHLFVPAGSRVPRTGTTPCPSVTGRPYPSPTSSP